MPFLPGLDHLRIPFPAAAPSLFKAETTQRSNATTPDNRSAWVLPVDQNRRGQNTPVDSSR